ncbi:MAG: FAD-dependent oxidoreductase [Spongiibacteraceae bacterium]|nr:FAD-dependent oxidoreductase [Spongiibacteraceae bacterium]
MKFGIAGAGLMGRLVAWQLLRRGHQVSVFDQDSMKGEASAARVAAAMLAPFSEVVSCERCVFDWGLRGLDLWPQLIQQLSADSGHETPFQRRGSVLVAHPQDQNLLIHLHQKLQACVSDYRESIESLDQSALQKLEPSLADTFTQGIFFRDEGCIDNWCLLDNLASAITSLGGEWNSGVTVEKVSAGALYIDQQKHSFDWVIDVRGVGAKNRFSDYVVCVVKCYGYRRRK